MLTTPAFAGAGSGPPPVGLDDVAAPRRVALVVGLDRYTADPTLHDLRYAAADARSVADLLEGQGYEVVRLLDAATPAGFQVAFSEATASLQHRDLFLMYFAGHAQLEPGGGSHALHLLFSDDQSARAGAGLAIDDLADQIGQLPVSQRVVLLDTCYSERTQQLLATLRGAPQVTVPDVGQFDAWVYSAAPQQSAQEDASLGHGVFTHYLLEALGGEADVDGDGRVEVLEAYNWVGYRTAEHTGGRQVPRLEETRVGWDDLPLTWVGEPRPPQFAVVPWYEQVMPGAQVWIDGLTRGPGAIAPGAHQVVVRQGEQVVLKRRMQVRRGEVLAWERWVDEAGPQGLIGIGGAWAAPQDRVPAWSGSLSGWGQPRSKVLWRPAIGGLVSVGRGEAAEQKRMEAGQAEVRLGLFGQPKPWLHAGPTVGAGTTWRVLDVGMQGAPLVSAGWHVDARGDHLWMGVDGGVRSWAVDGSWGVQPFASLSVGMRLR